MFRVLDIFPRFPHDNEQLLKQWIQAMRRKGWPPFKNDRICEKHFLPGDYQYPPNLPYSENLGRRYLKKDSVPSLFDFPDHLKKKISERRLPTKRTRNETTEAAAEAKPAKVQKISQPDHTYSLGTVSPR